MKAIKLLGVLGLAILVSGCRSYFRVEVSIFNGNTDEQRKASDAVETARNFGDIFGEIGARASTNGLDNGSLPSMISKQIAEANVAVLITAKSNTLSKDALMKTQEPMRELVEGGLREVIAEWPSRATRDLALKKLVQTADELRREANAVTGRPTAVAVSRIVAHQARFGEKENDFRRAKSDAELILRNTSMVLSNCANVVAKVTKGEDPSGFAVTWQEDTKREAKVIESTVAQSKRLVEYDASVDLSDSSWQFLADSPEANWSKFQPLKIEADGDANYVIIQQSMGDFRLKKLFNDPTEGYKAGVNIGKKTFQALATAAIAASTGGAVPPIPIKSSSKSDTNVTASPKVIEQLSTITASMARDQADMDQLLKTRRAVLKQTSPVLADLAKVTSADTVTVELLAGITNKVGTLKALLGTD